MTGSNLSMFGFNILLLVTRLSFLEAVNETPLVQQPEVPRNDIKAADTSPHGTKNSKQSNGILMTLMSNVHLL